MHYFKASVVIASLASIANAAAVDSIYQRDAALSVTLVKVGNALVKATVKNVGAKSLKLMKYGTIFDDEAPIEKLTVSTAESKVKFEGVLRSVKTTDLAEDVFYLLEAGATYETTINAASVHTLETGKYSVVAAGAVAYAEVGSTVLSGQAVAYKSNVVELDVDGELAKKERKAVVAIAERSILQAGCTTAQRTATVNALANCVTLARRAATAARSGVATKFSEYFKTTATATRTVVANRLTAIGNECASSTSGKTRYYCTDSYGYCSSNTLAYTLPSMNLVVNCPIYFSRLTALSRTCHAQDQASTTLHEMAHAPAVYSPYCQDNGYGYAAATRLTTALAVLNADSYALYANAIYVGC